MKNESPSIISNLAKLNIDLEKSNVLGLSALPLKSIQRHLKFA